MNSFLESLSIFDIWHALGGGDIRHKRAQAFWRNGDGFSVSLHPDKNCWYDFVANEGGGILRLVEVALDCDRHAALEWVADFSGVTLRHKTLEERRDYERRRIAAEAEGCELVQWRARMMNGLIVHRNLSLRLYHSDKRSILNGKYRTETELDLLMNECEEMEEQYQHDDAALDAWRGASWDDLLILFRERRHVA